MSTAADFISTDTPLDVLGSVTSITFDDQASLPIKDHDLTTEEVTFCCIVNVFCFFVILKLLLDKFRFQLH